MVGMQQVSVLLPVYNGASFVEKAIRSIQSQTYVNWELIILDDGSQDGSLAICREMAREDPRLRVLSNIQNLGLAPAMNRLVLEAGGQYLAIQEQDDVSLPDRLAAEVALLEKKQDVGLVSGIAEWLDHTGEVSAHFPGILFRGEQYPQNYSDMVRFLYIEQCKVVNAGCMFRRSVLDSLTSPVFDNDARMSIDWQFFMHVAHHWKIWGLNQVVVRMNRGTAHNHLTAQKQLQYREARRCIHKIHQIYSRDANSPINYPLYRRAMSTQLVLEGRSIWRFRGMLYFILAIIYAPANSQAWASIIELVSRGISKINMNRRQNNESSSQSN